MKRLFAIFLTVSMLLNCAPFAFAEEPQIKNSSVAPEAASTLIADDVPSVDAPAAMQIETAPTETVAATAELQTIYSGTCGDKVQWSLNTTNNLLTIYGTGAMTDWSSTSNVPWYSYRSSIKSITIVRGVTSIGNYAFYGCSSLSSVTVPDSVTSIADYAFSGCSSLTSVRISDLAAWCAIPFKSISSNPLHYAHNLYLNGELLTIAEISDSMTCIEDFALCCCTCLKSIIVSENNPFYMSVEGVLFDKSMTTLLQCPGGKNGDYTIPDSVVNIKDCAFAYCSSLKSVTIPDSVTDIGDFAFVACTGLKNITIPDGVTSIGWQAFQSCSVLESVTIGSGVTNIGGQAFYDCGKLTSVSIPDGIISIGSSAFSHCGSLAYNVYDQAKYLGNSSNPYVVLVEATSTSISACAIHPDTKLIYSPAFRDCSSLTSIAIPDSVISVCGSAFQRCSSLTSVTIPDSVTSIGSSAFSECDSLSSIVIPASVASIGSDAFWYSGGLTSITIANSVSSIGSGAFNGCSSLTNIIYCGTEDQWNSISIGNYNDPLKNAARQYHTEHSWGNGTSIISSSCLAEGKAIYTCSICGMNKTEIIPAHSYIKTTGIDPTCLNGGWALLTCKDCGEQKYETYDALGHDLAHHDAQAATCEAIGWDAYDTCTRCDYTTYGEIPALGHDYVGTVTTEASCTADGEMTYVCSHDAAHTYTEVIPALGHDPVLMQRVEPTTTSTGIEIFVCSRCGLTSSNVLPVITYTLGDINNDGAINAKDVTTLRRALAGGYGVAVPDTAVADVNKDGTVNAKDVTYLRRAIAGGYGITLG